MNHYGLCCSCLSWTGPSISRLRPQLSLPYLLGTFSPFSQGNADLRLESAHYLTIDLLFTVYQSTATQILLCQISLQTSAPFSAAEDCLSQYLCHLWMMPAVNLLELEITLVSFLWYRLYLDFGCQSSKFYSIPTWRRPYHWIAAHCCQLPLVSQAITLAIHSIITLVLTLDLSFWLAMLVWLAFSSSLCSRFLRQTPALLMKWESNLVEKLDQPEISLAVAMRIYCSECVLHFEFPFWEHQSVPSSSNPECNSRCFSW